MNLSHRKLGFTSVGALAVGATLALSAGTGLVSSASAAGSGVFTPMAGGTTQTPYTCSAQQLVGTDGGMSCWTVAPDTANPEYAGNLPEWAQCTYWAAENAPWLWNDIPMSYQSSDSGIAGWVQGAQASGLTVSSTPVPGSIAVFPGDGHVAYVVSVTSTSIVLSEMNADGDNNTIGEGDTYTLNAAADGSWYGMVFINPPAPGFVPAVGSPANPAVAPVQGSGGSTTTGSGGSGQPSTTSPTPATWSPQAKLLPVKVVHGQTVTGSVSELSGAGKVTVQARQGKRVISLRVHATRTATSVVYSFHARLRPGHWELVFSSKSVGRFRSMGTKYRSVLIKPAR